jgi:probable rRNA maturation factor
VSAAAAAHPALRVETQLAARRPWVPAAAALRRWARAAYDAATVHPRAGRRQGAAASTASAVPPPRVCIRVISAAESRRLNLSYRGKDAPTNVLSFPASPEERTLDGAIGDLAICAPVVAAEARAQGKPLPAHWAHMVVHGVLHLMDHDHRQDGEARRMERVEVEILRAFGYQNPYHRVVTSRA